MKRYIRSSDAVDPKTGKPVKYYDYFSSSSATSKIDFLKNNGYRFLKQKSFKHGWYSIYENDDQIAVVMYDDGNANFNRPY